MNNVTIEDLAPGLVRGVSVMLQSDVGIHKERFFEWQASILTADFETNKVTGGVLRSWRHTPVFNEIETHTDREMFYFVKGTAIMIFIDVDNGKPDMNSAQMVRIQPGTQIVIDAGKGHFVAVAENDEPVYAVVVAPKMTAPRITLPENVIGI